VAHALARIGVGRLIIADFDVVEPSNLNRQAFRVEQIGRKKVEALAEDLGRINPLVQVDIHPVRLTAANISTLFHPCRVVVECFDRPDQKQILVETVRMRLPEVWVVAASGLAGTGDSNLIRTRAAGTKFLLVGDGESAATFGRGLMAPRVLVAAGHQANATVRLLLNEES
jgi:sulfur carrier protein ThiS adenylyltransferase